ncbi:hypothetical protein PPTG_07472 [Phytophthora nicotianae INRA-310]|uniref:Uncharacterized protein n=1 Tax=Phytophthora nicotianae (strain INRA-310) TaxID=761204 RepID=W2QN94_PHYN3|nr:hypothetical protein PPTG_07472 [Phytophthora nicotianae INRA-310]ETN14421.1 hypothetical protein PPTG_07472 [Phytophthora nicotianae INRA-310]
MKSFPTASLLPKEETLADRFLQQYPDYDGRNAVVAIFDTGVDPGAIGLQTTPDGRPKIIDVVDATGAGDVDTSTVIEAKDGQLTLANDRVLTLNPDWKPSQDGKYHVGTVAGYHLFPGPLVTRLKTERKEKFDIEQRAAVNAVQEQLAKWSKENSATTNDTAKLREKKDLQTRLKQLEELAKSYEDPGPIYDAVVFYDGTCWRAALDTKETGDFTGIPVLTNFKDERQYATFSGESQLNYVLNIYDEGNTLSVVNDVGAHGTHVAGIVAAYHPDQSECNGVAPGAQIVAVKIGDGRLGSMETSSALSRAILAVMDANVDVVNMSYGEYASQHNYGRIVELSNELVDEHNVTFVVSAGNNGPALGTVGAPGGTTSSMLAVGAYVSPKMMEGEYIMRDSALSGIAYTWSSRGPTFDGDLGVNICAPGAAIAPVPNWTLNKKQLMNGTSMSSPNCAGNIALLISAMKAQGVEYTPYSIRRALENTAVKVPNVEVYAQGKGLIQVLPAFKYLAGSNSFDGGRKFPLHYEIKTSSGDGKARGIFLRDSVDFAHDSTEVNVTVTPKFHKKAVQDDKVHFEQHVRLVPSARWIDVGRNLALMHGGRAFKVLVKTKHLTAGEHYGEIVAYDTKNEARGALFTIPVTVIKPEDAKSVVTYQTKFQPGDISRRFFTPAQDSTWADIIFSRANENDREVESNASGKLYMFDALQFQPFVRQSSSSFHKAFFLKPGEEVAFSMDLLGGLTTEFCLGQFWSALGDSIVQIEIRFHGVKPDQEKIVPKDERDEEEIANEAVRDLLLERVTKLVGKSTFLPAWQRLVDQFPNYLPAMQAKLHHFDFEANRSTQLAAVIEAADAVLALIKQDELALFFGTRSVPGDQPATEKKLRKEKEKAILVDALARKARALGDSSQWDDFLLAYADLQKWEDVEAATYLHVSLLHDRHFDAFGLALQRLRKVQDMEQADKTKIISDEKLAAEINSTLDALQWQHWTKYETQWERRRAPTSYRIF